MPYVFLLSPQLEIASQWDGYYEKTFEVSDHVHKEIILKVSGQTVLITGSGSGLGRLMAFEFGKLGARLVLWDINEQGNKETLKELEAMGVEVWTCNIFHIYRFIR